MGRGTFYYTPSDSTHGRVTFQWKGDKYNFRLPKAEEAGAVLELQNPDFDGHTQSPTFA